MKHMSKMAGRVVGIVTSLIATCSLSMSAFATTVTTENTEEMFLQYDHIEELSDGGKIYVYIIDGIKNSFPVPPKGFDPLKASDETLTTYGFPPRPSDVQELDEWMEDMEAYEYTPVPEIQKTDIVHGVYKPALNSDAVENKICTNMVDSINDNTYSTNWSGYVAKGNFAMVQGDFIQPTINPSNPSYTHESTWVGLGGYSSNKLVQTGTAMNTYNGTNNYYAWYEYLGTSGSVPEIRFTNITINPGDEIHTYCSFQGANDLFNAYVANNSNGTSQSVLVSLPASVYFDSSTAEFINEHPSWNVTDNGLTNYGTTKWKNCQIYKMTNSWVNLGSTTYDLVTMTNSSQIKAKPSGLNGQTFTSTWYNY